MTLRTKSLAIVLASMACLILVLHLAGRYIILESCAQIERMAAADGVERVLRILQDRQDGLKVMAKDYAAWDDTYRFVATHDPEYVEANLVEATFQNARLTWSSSWTMPAGRPSPGLRRSARRLHASAGRAGRVPGREGSLAATPR